MIGQMILANRSEGENPGGFAKSLEPRQLNSFKRCTQCRHRRIKARIEVQFEVCQKLFYSPISVMVLDGGRSEPLIPATGLKHFSLAGNREVL